MNRITAVVLAGGRGDRLGGVRKATLKFGGVRLVDRVVDVLAGHCDRVLVSTGRIDPDRFLLPVGTTALPDLDLPLAGPLAGLAAAAFWAEAEARPPDLLISLAVDTPLAPRNYVPTMLEGLSSDAPAAYATCGESFYPTNAIWRRASLERLVAEIRNGTPPSSLRRYLESLGARAIAWPQSAPDDPFASLNTLGDLISLTHRIRRDR